MNTSALILMLLTVTLVAGMTIYFFIKVIITPTDTEADSDVVEESMGIVKGKK